MPGQTALGRFLAQPRVAGEPGVFFLGPLLAAEPDLLGVDHDDKIAGVDMRSIGRPVLAAQDRGDLHSQSADDLVSRVDHIPSPFKCFRLGHESGHKSFRLAQDP